MQTHIVPVGFDYDRLIAPLARDQIDVDRVILLEGAVGSEANVEYSRHLSRKLEQDFQNLLGATADRFVLENVYDYDEAFEQAYRLIDEELDRGNDVWVNISAMPRTVSFAFATAAHSLTVERQSDRERIHTYYTAPEKYLETELAEELRKQTALLADLLTDSTAGSDSFDESNSDVPEPERSESPTDHTGRFLEHHASNRAEAESTTENEVVAESIASINVERLVERFETGRALLAEFDERGTTIGAKEIDGTHVVELPVAPFTNVKPFEELVLFKLGEDGEFASASELARALADEFNEEYTDSFRSKVIYTVDRLGPGGKGYVEREQDGKSYRTRLSRIGELWVRAHSDL